MPHPDLIDTRRDTEGMDANPSEWFAATLDSADFDLRQTLRPPPDTGKLAADTLLAGAHPLGGERQGLSGLADLPHLTWVDATGEPEGSDRPATTVPADLTLLHLLGEGGMGRVHLAQQRSLGREVAVKTVRPQADRAAVRLGLWREALVMARLDHPHVVPVHVLGVDRQGRPALVMKRIDGVSWQRLLDDPDHPGLQRLGGRDRLEKHLEILEKVAIALEFAHARGILHRDVKPDNVMVGSYGEVFLGDWGVALDLGQPAPAGVPEPVVGTPGFLAPEVLLQRREMQGPALDLFLLGATLHTVLTGRPRHAGATLREVLDNARQPAAVAYGPEVPAPLAALCQQACAADPAQRGTVAGFRTTLREFLRNRGLQEVAQAAKARLAELDSLIAAGPGTDRQAYIRTVHRLSSEARFGFLEVRRADPAHAGARAGLDACLERMIAFALQNGHVAEARALYQELDRVDPQWESRIAELEQQTAAEQARVAALEQRAADHDPTVAAGVRALALVPVVLISVVIGSTTAQADQTTVVDATRYGLIAVVVMVVSTLFLRRVVRTALNRSLLWTGTFAMGLVALHRALEVWRGVTDLPSVLAADALLLAGVTFSLRYLGRAVLLATALAVSGAVAIQLWPERAVAVFGALTLLLPIAVSLPPWLAHRRKDLPG